MILMIIFSEVKDDIYFSEVEDMRSAQENVYLSW